MRRPVVALSVALLALTGCSGGGGTGDRSSASGGKDGKDGSAGGPVTITVSSSGDVLVHRPVADSARELGHGRYDFSPIFAGVRSRLSASDVAICHMETPVAATDADMSRPGSMVYNAAPEIAPALKKAGFDGCDNVSNHVWDQQAKGIPTTRSVLSKAGLKVSGATLDAGHPGEPAVYETHGVKVANLAYTYTVTNQATPSTHTPPGYPSTRQVLWPARGVAGILADAKRAKQRGADLVVVNIHWGTEYQQSPTDDQVRMARQLLASPYVDGIFGAHAHVLQPCVTTGGKTAFYGLGNFLSHQGPGNAPGQGEQNTDGAIATYTFTRGPDGRWTQKASYTPTQVHLDDEHRIRVSPRGSASFQRTDGTMHRGSRCSATAG